MVQRYPTPEGIRRPNVSATLPCIFSSACVRYSQILSSPKYPPAYSGGAGCVQARLMHIHLMLERSIMRWPCEDDLSANRHYSQRLRGMAILQAHCHLEPRHSLAEEFGHLVLRTKAGGVKHMGFTHRARSPFQPISPVHRGR